ncbi:MAG: hypothetical protein DDT28_00920 [Dehalococcoidia bacterium]|nr:hypothetical protein [Chloroflexota bacterium]MBT9160570.1 hypothetical protein [Chloroflexota bacterium]
MIGIITVERGVVKGDAQASLSMLQEISVAGVGLLGGAEASEHAHRPELAPITSAMDTTKKGVFARHPEVSLAIGISDLTRSVNPLDWQAGGGGEIAPTLRACFSSVNHLIVH